MDEEFRIVPCQACGTEGRIYYGGGSKPGDWSEPCIYCEGTGGEIVAVQPITEEDLGSCAPKPSGFPLPGGFPEDLVTPDPRLPVWSKHRRWKMAYSVKSALSLALWEGGGEIEVEAVIDFTVTRFRAATLESPEEPPMAEVSRFRIRKPKTGEWLACPSWISDAFESDESFMSWLVSEAGEQDSYAEECAAESAREIRQLENEEMARHFERHPHG